MHELCDRFGVDTLIAAMDELLERNRRAMLHLIRNTVGEDETLYFEDYVCDDGLGMGPYKMACKMWRDGDVLVFDFEGTDPQSESSINFFLNEEMFKMFVGVYMINVFDPQIMFNDGFYDHVDVRIPPGTLLKPLKPAALSSRTHALGRIFDVLGGLLGQRAPNLMVAAGFSDSPHFMYSGYSGEGEWYQLYQIGFGGIPGRPAGDGPDGHSLWPSFTNVPNEFLEAYFPLRIEVYETIADSGGPGLHRGGNGVTIGYRALEPGEMSLHDDRWLTYPWGVNGGLPGGRSRKEIHRADGSFEVLPSKCDHVKVEAGDLLLFKTWGGGGWGDPLERDPALVALEVERGLVTRAGAERYGVILRDDLMVDEEATEALAREAPRRAGRGEALRSRRHRRGAARALPGGDRARAAQAAGVQPPRAALPAGARGQGRRGRRRGGVGKHPHLTPTLSAPRGGEGVSVRPLQSVRLAVRARIHRAPEELQRILQPVSPVAKLVGNGLRSAPGLARMTPVSGSPCRPPPKRNLVSPAGTSPALPAGGSESRRSRSADGRSFRSDNPWPPSRSRREACGDSPWRPCR